MVTREGHLSRSTKWAGLTTGDPVAVNGQKEMRQNWVFVAHVTNTQTNEDWIEVRGGRSGEAKSRSFRPEMIYAIAAKRNGRLRGSSLANAPQLPLF